MADIPGLPGDVFFGDPARPLPDWRGAAQPDEPDDDEPTEADYVQAAGMLGLDPRELDEAQPSPSPAQAAGRLGSILGQIRRRRS